MEAVAGRYWDQSRASKSTDKSCYEGSGKQHLGLAPKNSDSGLEDKPPIGHFRTCHGSFLSSL